MKKLLLSVMVCFALIVQAQQQNPRGVYKLTSLESSRGKFDAPFDQYKICSNMTTLMLSIDEGMHIYSIGDNDHKAFDYTGEEPDKEDSKALEGVWYLASIDNEELASVTFGKSLYYRRIKVFNPFGEYACAEITNIISESTFSILPHEYGKWTYRDGIYTEMGREGNLKMIDNNTFTFEWAGTEEVWKKMASIPKKLTNYIVNMCKTESNAEKDGGKDSKKMQKYISKYIFKK